MGGIWICTQNLPRIRFIRVLRSAAIEETLTRTRPGPVDNTYALKHGPGRHVLLLVEAEQHDHYPAALRGSVYKRFSLALAYLVKGGQAKDLREALAASMADRCQRRVELLHAYPAESNPQGAKRSYASPVCRTQPTQIRIWWVVRRSLLRRFPLPTCQ